MLSGMRFLGIDYGEKRVGLALSDESGMMAFPLSVLQNDKTLLSQIEGIVKEKKVEEIVIGHSLDKDGKENSIHEAANELMTDLTLAVGLPIHLEPEQYTTQAAIREQGRNDQTDAAAAALILESYLARHRPGSAFDDLNK